MNDSSTTTNTRHLPQTITTLNANRSSKRKCTAIKRAVFVSIYTRVVTEIDAVLFSDPRTDVEACWSAVCARRFRSMDIKSRVTHIAIERAVRQWLMDKLEHFNTPQDVQRRAEIATAAAATAAAANRPAIQEPPRTMDGLVSILKNSSPEIINAVLQNVHPSIVTRVFYLLGLGESGDMCPVCMEPKQTWARMTKECVHKYCKECALQWVKTCTTTDGLGCPMCMRNGIPKEKCIANPRLMFSAITLKQDRSLMSFSSLQIPLLQHTLDTAYSSSHITNCRCPECFTISTNGNAHIRICHNPTCAAEFCIKCNCIIGPEEPRVRHVNGTCVQTAVETTHIIKEKGISTCPQCGGQVWHATGHGCHSVKCPLCSNKFCHACGVSCTVKCSCPIFCKDGFICKCAAQCPECTKKKCEHCSGTCASCMERERKK